MTTLRIEVGRLRHHPDNPPGRRGDVAELADSIRAVGILQPLLVEPDGDGFVVVAGNRRLAAARLAGLAEVECTVRQATNRGSHTEVRLIENGHRRALSPMEQARAFGQLRTGGLPQAAIAARTGFSISHVSDRLALLELGAVTQDRVERGVLSADVALAAVRAARRPPTRENDPGHGPGKQYEATPLAPDHFGRGHPLAAQAHAVCRRTHGPLLASAGLGGIACGRCWENAIRADEHGQAVDAVAAAAPTPMEVGS